MISTLYALGYPMEKLHNYDGSWIGWSKVDKLPLEKGCPDATKAPWQK
jgi:thiosulfate/3-mercaptopyruvate sulfurtransferase